MDDIRDDLRSIKQELSQINITLARNTASLELHIARTTQNEARIARVENWTVGLLVSILLCFLGILVKGLL